MKIAEFLPLNIYPHNFNYESHSCATSTDQSSLKINIKDVNFSLPLCPSASTLTTPYPTATRNRHGKKMDIDRSSCKESLQHIIYADTGHEKLSSS